MNIATFSLQKNENFIIKSQYNLCDIVTCTELAIYFESQEKSFIVHYDFIEDALLQLSTLLKKSLNRDLYLHHSIDKNIGYLWNCKLHGESGLHYKKYDNQMFWIGEQHHLWETPGNVYPNLATWIYNDFDGSIILEITPVYPWHFVDPANDQKYISYEVFMKQYAPLVVRTIPDAIAIMWQEQADMLLDCIERNSEKVECSSTTDTSD